MLAPADYAEDESALFHPLTRRMMQQIDFRHGGPDYDRRYPDGIPTTVELSHAKLGPLTSGLVMYPQGHARADATELAVAAWSTSAGCWPGRRWMTWMRSWRGSRIWRRSRRKQIAESVRLQDSRLAE